MSRVYDIFVRDEYSSDGEARSKFYNVGTAFTPKDGDGLNCEIPPGLAVSGRFFIRPRKAKGGEKNGGSARPGYDPGDDEIPF